jgi:hypothetical protein
MRAAIHPTLSFSLCCLYSFYAAAGYCSMRLQIMELVLLLFWGGTGDSFGPGRPAADPKVASICVWVRAMAHPISKKTFLTRHVESAYDCHSSSSSFCTADLACYLAACSHGSFHKLPTLFFCSAKLSSLTQTSRCSV